MASETTENGFRQASGSRSNAPYFKDQNSSMGFSFSISAGSTNQSLVSISAVDGTSQQNQVISSQLFDFWLSDSPTGYGLSATIPSGNIAATTGSIEEISNSLLVMEKRLITTNTTPVVVPGFPLGFGEAGTLRLTATGNDANTNATGGRVVAFGYRQSSGNVILVNANDLVYTTSASNFEVVADTASQSLAAQVTGISTTYIWNLRFELQKSILPSSKRKVQANSSGVLTLSITDFSKTPYYLCAQNPFTGQVFVSRQLTTADYGA